jgi:hypothetical protein
MAFADDFPRLSAYNFPNLVSGGYELISPETEDYNCIAYAAGDEKRWWWPDPLNMYFWPATRALTLAAFVEAFETLGYKRCVDGSLEAGHEKIAIFMNQNGPKHAARQKNDGTWCSKLGDDKDIEHPQLAAVAGPLYGTAVQFMRRRRKQGRRARRTG